MAGLDLLLTSSCTRDKTRPPCVWQDDLTSTASQGDKSSMSRDHLTTDSSAAVDSFLGRHNHHPQLIVMFSFI